jgi:hypothetical protein
MEKADAEYCARPEKVQIARLHRRYHMEAQSNGRVSFITLLKPIPVFETQSGRP